MKPGGRLVYVTCSLLPEENEDQVVAFIAADPAFRIVPPREAIAVSGAAPGLADAALAGGHGMVLSPRRTGTDGFFVAVMQRT